MEVLFEDEHLLLRGTEGETSDAFVSFTGVGGGLGGIQTDEFVGTTASGRNTALFLTDKTRSWSNHLNYGLIRNLLDPFVKGKKTYFLGNSMGGFNAIVCSHFVAPDVCVVFSPQYSVADSIVPEENRWRQYRSGIREMRYETLLPYFNQSTSYYAFFGSEAAEERHSSLFPKLPNLRIYRIDGAEHTLAELLKKNGLLRGVIAECKAQGEPLNVLAPTLKASII